MKILIADDEANCRQLLQDMFASDSDVELSMAHNGAEAWWRLTEPGTHFDLAIFDLRMPVVDGLELSERIRKSTAHCLLPIILCTGIHDRHTVSRAVCLAIDQYIVKPYRLPDMRRKIVFLTSRHLWPNG